MCIRDRIITTAHTQAAYTREYAGSESDSRVIFDGQSAGSASSQKFDLYPILYPEGSTHSLSVISRDGGDVLHYARGMASLLILSDIWKDESKVASHSGVELTPMGAVCAGDSGQLTSVAFSAAQSVQACLLYTSKTVMAILAILSSRHLKSFDSFCYSCRFKPQTATCSNRKKCHMLHAHDTFWRTHRGSNAGPFA